MADESKREIPFKILVETLTAEKSVGELKQEFRDLTKVIEETKVGTDEYNRATNRLAAVKEVLQGVASDVTQVANANKSAVGSILPLQREYKELQRIIQTRTNASGEILSKKELDEARIRLGQVAGQIRDIKQQAIALDPERRFASFARVGSTIASGFAAAQAAVALFGKENEDLVRVLVKVQAATALAQGLQGVVQLQKEFKVLKLVALDALTGIKAGIIATGVGALVVLLGTLISQWDKIKQAVGGVSSEQKKLLEQEQKSLKAQQEKLDAISKQENILKLAGKTEKEILDLKIKQSEVTEKVLDTQIETQIQVLKAQTEAEKRNKKILEGLLRFVSLPITAVLEGIDLISNALGKKSTLAKDFFGKIASVAFDPEDTKKKGDEVIKELQDQQTKIKNDRAGFQLQLKDIDKKATDERLKDIKKSQEDELKLLEAHKLILQLNNENTAVIEIEIENKKLEFIKNSGKATRTEIEIAEAQHKARLIEISKNQIEKAIEDAEKIVSIEEKKWERIKNFRDTIEGLTLENIIQEAELTEDPIAIENAQFASRLENFNIFREQQLALIDQSDATDIEKANQKVELLSKLDDKERLLKADHEKKLTAITVSAAEQRKQMTLQAAASGFASLGQLVLAFAGKNEASQRRAFNVSKAFNIAQATIETYAAASSIFANASKNPITGFFPPYAYIQAGAAILAGLARVAQIASVQFNASGGGSTPGGGGASAPSISGGEGGGFSFAPPQITPPQIGGAPVQTDGDGNFVGFTNQPQQPPTPPAPIRAYVVETDITNTQKNIRGIEERSQF